MSFWSEGGPVEVASALLLGLAAILLAVRAAREPSLWHLPVLALLLCLRELDLDKAAGAGLLKSRTYTGDAPLGVKLLGLAVIALTLSAAWRLVRRGRAPFLAAWRGGAAWPGLLVAGVVMVGVAKAIDGLNRKLEPFGLAVSERAAVFAGRAEETMELGFAALVVAAVLSAWRGRPL